MVIEDKSASEGGEAEARRREGAINKTAAPAQRLQCDASLHGLRPNFTCWLPQTGEGK